MARTSFIASVKNPQILRGVAKWSESQNWDALREQFYELNDDNQFKYKTIQDFAAALYPGTGPHDVQLRNWVLYSIGPRSRPGFPYKGDWAEERFTDERRYNAQIRLFKRKLEDEFDMLSAGRVLADTYIPFQQRIYEVWREMENVYGRSITLARDPQGQPVPDAKNLARIEDYLALLEKIVTVKTKVDNQVLRTLGFDRPQMMMQFNKLVKNEQQPTVVENRVESIMVELARNQIEKSKMYDLPLPDDIETVARAIESEESKKTGA